MSLQSGLSVEAVYTEFSGIPVTSGGKQSTFTCSSNLKVEQSSLLNNHRIQVTFQGTTLGKRTSSQPNTHVLKQTDMHRTRANISQRCYNDDKETYHLTKDRVFVVQVLRRLVKNEEL
jgi:hypothetical protein